MELSERTLLLTSTKTRPYQNELSVVFAIICIVDVFGVFPVITLPKAIIDCGLYGILVIGAVCVFQVYTAILLGKCWIIAEKLELSVENKNRYPYSALAEITYGTTFSNFVSLLVNVTIFCGGIPNLIVASQNLQLLGERLNIFDVSFCYWIVITGMILCPVLWLGSPKDMKLLCTISVIFVILVFLLVVGCLIFSPVEPILEDVSLTSNYSLWELIFIFYGIITFQFDIHPSILTIQVDMREKSSLNLAVVGGFTRMFAIVTLIAAVKYGSSVQPSLLETLQTTVPLHFAAFFVAVQLCLSLAVTNSALFQDLEDCMGIQRAFNHRRCILRTTLTLFAILIAEAVPRFDLVMSLIGGTLTGPLVFILPPLFYLKMTSKERLFIKQKTFTRTIYSQSDDEDSVVVINHCKPKTKNVVVQKIETIFCVAIILISIFSTIATTYVNIKNAVEFINFTQPCILNISATLVQK